MAINHAVAGLVLDFLKAESATIYLSARAETADTEFC